MFSLDQPLRRLTNVPALRRRPNAPPRARRNQAPDPYDLEYNADPAASRRPRWTEPGAALVAPERAPDRSDPRRSQRDPRDPRDPRGSLGAPAGAAPDRAPSHDDEGGDSPDRRWNAPGWLGQPPAPGEAPPDDDLPNAPRYEPVDPQSQQTDYRATSARAALWASRTPNYQPGQPPPLGEQEGAEDHAYFESYDTSRAPASLAHTHASMAGAQPQAYTPGAPSEVERLRRDEYAHGRIAGPAPYFWEMGNTPRPAS
ncbi:MAG TPA: hypothetical protein VIC27_07360, partial [Ktedonobacterales bacterium]